MNKITDSNKKNWGGSLKMKFLKQKNGVFFYEVNVNYRKEKIRFILPRYCPMVGWIEIFGLPPQNEWVFLEEGERHWAKNANIVLGGANRIIIKESIEVFNNNSDGWRLIKLSRKTKDLFENQMCMEDWSRFRSQGYIKKQMVFYHSNGVYYATIDEYRNPRKAALTGSQAKYLKEVLKEKGKPSLGIWLKSFSAWGDPPPIYYKLFPFWGDNFRKGRGGSIEIGYEKEMLHGDWFKLFEIEGKKYEIEEGGWKSREVMHGGKKINVKDTYEKKIRETI